MQYQPPQGPLDVDLGLYRLLWLEGNSVNECVCVVDSPAETRLLKYSLPRRISSSCSKGMSPHTMSYSSTPSDHTVAERPWYRWKRIHSGGLYTLVPKITKI
ncbi:hypothetical protein EYF80_017871 [Liparis tanakae]|uniref:Uncharacterized protein n=1 Tax=Liparis tanakae TaxID=230148 RepID=A0A4Z2I3H5_9TELE|nr:hypothetical protein EYF80_017871 [Liparis tanakae]